MKKTQVVILFPDYQGKEFFLGDASVFMRRVREAMPEAILVPILNGTVADSISEGTEIITNNPQLQPIIARHAQGLRSALEVGYAFAISEYPEAIVVRLDTAEHPPEEIPRLTQAIQETGVDMIIGDLAFDETTLRTGSADYFAHINFFPTLYYFFAKLQLSCAHGFQVFAPGALQKIFPIAQKIAQEAGNPPWGFDGAMAIAARIANMLAIILQVQAEKMRDRPLEKVLDQLGKAMQMCLAAQRLYPKLF